VVVIPVSVGASVCWSGPEKRLLPPFLLFLVLKEDLIDVAPWYDRRTKQALPYQRIRLPLKKANRLMAWRKP